MVGAGVGVALATGLAPGLGTGLYSSFGGATTACAALSRATRTSSWSSFCRNSSSDTSAS